MALPTISESNREVILLSGFETVRTDWKRSETDVVICDEKDLRSSIKKNIDAVAFGYVAGRWVAVA